MKKLKVTIVLLFILCGLLQGCGAGSEASETARPPETQSTIALESRTAEETALTAENTLPAESSLPEESTRAAESLAEESTPEESESGEESEITADMAYEGILRYCRQELGFRPESGLPATGLEMVEETALEYALLFRSYTGAYTYFYVEKAGGLTRLTEYVPALDLKNEAGTINLFDYLGEESPEEPTETSPERQRFVFQPLVCSVYMEEVFGKAMCETWAHLVDAVMAGENTFACPDQHTYDWVMGQFPERCFPVLTELIDYAWDRENSVKDGVASFTWKVSPEEAAARIADFAAQIEGILNEALEDDYSDFEKVLALYLYFSDHYAYDYEMYDRTYTDPFAEVSCLRFFQTGAGICQEISTAYSYLLMQAGVEATTMSGKRSFDNESHQWSYVRINGEDFHVDPTYVISDKGSLSYLMMTDEQRFDADGYDRSAFRITSNYSEDHPHPDYAAGDGTFSAIWRYTFDSFLPDQNLLYGSRWGEYGEKENVEFDYTGY